MDPFALQQAARVRTSRLVALAVAAVLATAAAMGAVMTVAGWATWLWLSDADVCADASAASISTFCGQYPTVPLACFLAAAFFVAVATLVKFGSLSSGEALMESIGAKRLARGRLSESDEDDIERLRLLNVCEEISIASGLDMPSVWVLEDEGGINALAAGSDPSSAAVCVTRGSLEWLTRDELQGVVAHEFSHILNGDMRLNFRLTALVCGITTVSRLGKGMLSLLTADDDDRSYRILWGSGRSRTGTRLPAPC